jgi:EAL domain-containing protein (putative c-di-GMP-specific phosphodiesterase class I)/GGDEF domain-containing protein
MADERDPLTGLIGLEAAGRQVAAWQGETSGPSPAPIHALLLRIRRFSSVNLAYGAAAGDRALVEVAARIGRLLDREFGEDRLVARVGGGAFFVAVARPCSRERWEALAEELARVVGQPIGEGGEGTVRLRPRMALLRAAPGEPLDRMMGRLADTLDRAQDHPAQLMLWVDGSHVFGSRRAQQLEADLLGALDRGEIQVLFQPQYAAAGRAVVGAEALARWQHPELGQLGADSLFAIAQRADHVASLSEHIARLALEQAAKWEQRLRLSLNITAADLAVADFAGVTRETVLQSGFPPELLTLESSARQLDKLTAMGIRVALDDFGAGFCNFRYLKMLPLHALKLDRSMVEGIVESERDLAVLRAIVAMARALDLGVIAEGVETEAQREVIEQEGCAVWQGFLGAPPLEAKAFARLAASG